MDEWAYWINEPVYLDDGVMNIAKRKHAIAQFVQEGLLPFLHRAGYRVCLQEKELIVVLLRLLFALHKGKQIAPIEVEGDYMMEQYDLYCYVLDTETWMQFWKGWGTLQDFSEGRPGYKLQFTLADFVWSWLDFESSSRAFALYEELEEEQYQEEMAKGKEDPYLQDTSKRDFQDRHWH
jgi:hypothetical protein